MALAWGTGSVLDISDKTTEGLRYSVSDDLLCAFELLSPLDGQALRKEMAKARRKR